MKNKITIKSNELPSILAKTKGVTFAHVVAFTDEHGSRMIKGKRQLQKVTFRNITIGSPYDARVNRRLEKQGEEATFEAEAMSGKQFVEGSKILAFATKTPSKLYLVCDQEKNTKARTIFFHNGKKISKGSAIEQQLFAPSYFAEKKTAGRGLVDKENDFKRLTLTIDNIIAIKINKVEYIIED